MKYSLLQEQTTLPMISIAPLYLAPSGDRTRGLGNGRYQLFVPVWLQKNWGPWTCNGGVGYWINHASQARNNWFAVWQIERPINDRMTVGAEVFYRGEQYVGKGASTGFNLGDIFVLSARDRILVSLGRGLQNRTATNRLSSYLAYQMTF